MKNIFVHQEGVDMRNVKTMYVSICLTICIQMLSACGDLQVNPPAQPEITFGDGGVDPAMLAVGPLTAPAFDILPVTGWRYSVVTLRGTATGDRVVITDQNQPENPISVPINNGQYCVDMPVSDLGAAGQRDLDIFSFSAKQEQRSPSTSAVLNYDPMAGPIADAHTCNNQDPANCGQIEICNDGKDNDCDGQVDFQDDTCVAPCVNDDLEANDAIQTATSVQFASSYTRAGLVICPSDVDVFQIQGFSSVALNIAVSGFESSQGNIDLKLFTLDTNGRAKLLKSSVTNNDAESLAYTPDSDMPLFVYVSGHLPGASNTYDLSITQ